MKAVLIVLFAVGVSGYEVSHGGGVRKCSGGAGCPGSAAPISHGEVGLPAVPANPNRRVASVSSGSGYWWQKNNPFTGAGQRAPSTAGAKPISSGVRKTSSFPSAGNIPGGSYPSPGNRPVSVNNRPSIDGSRPISGANKFPGTSSITNKFPGGSSSQHQQPFQSTSSNAIIGPMGICPANFVCVHWQLCKNGQVILDGSGRIDKSKRKPFTLTEKSCGGDMICCGVTPGYTVPGVISSLTSLQTGGASAGLDPCDVRGNPNSGTRCPSRPSPDSFISSFGQGSVSKPVATGVNPFIKNPIKPLNSGANSQPGNYNPQGNTGGASTQQGCGNSVFGNCGNNLNSGNQPNSAIPAGGYNPTGSSSGFNQPGSGGSPVSGNLNPSGSLPSGGFKPPGSGGSPAIGSYNPSDSSPSGGFNQPGSGGSSAIGSYNPSSSSPSGGFNQPGSGGSPASGSYNPSDLLPNGGFNQPGSGGSSAIGSYNPSGSSPSGGFNQPGSEGSLASGSYNPSDSSPSGGFSQPGSGGSPAIGSYNPSGSSPNGGFNQPAGGGSLGTGSYNPPDGSLSGSIFNPSGSLPGGFNQPTSGGTGSSASGNYNPSGSSPGSFNQPSGSYNPGGSSSIGSNQPSGALNFPSAGSSQGNKNPARPGSTSNQQNSPPMSMSNMMAGMMGMGGSPFVPGSCSAGTFCVPEFQCNPYNGFIIMNPNNLQAVWHDAPKVPLIRCLIPAGVLDNGVCCQQNHPIIGPGGKPVD